MTAVNSINPSVFSNFIVPKQPITAQPQSPVKPQESTSAVPQVALPAPSETIPQVEPQQAPSVEVKKESSLSSGAKVAIGVALAALAGVGIYVWRRRGANVPVIKPNVQPPVLPSPGTTTPTAPTAASVVEGVVENAVQKTVEFKNKIAQGIREIIESFKPEEDYRILKSGKEFLLDRNTSMFRIRNKSGEAIVQGYVDSKGNLKDYFIARGHIFSPAIKRTWRVAEDGSEYISRFHLKLNNPTAPINEVKL